MDNADVPFFPNQLFFRGRSTCSLSPQEQPVPLGTKNF